MPKLGRDWGLWKRRRRRDRAVRQAGIHNPRVAVKKWIASLYNDFAMKDTLIPAPQRLKRGQIVERDGRRYVVVSVGCNGVIELHTENGSFAMFLHVN